MGGGGGAQSQQPLDMAEEQYVKAKISVWWDIENCHVPKACDPHAIAQNISSALVKLNYCGPVSISAYGDTNRISSAVQQALNSTGIALNHVPAGVKDASDKKILVDMLFWAVDNPAPANYLLISGDRDFSNALHQLRMRRYNILLAQPYKASAPLLAAAKSVWLWTSLSAGGPPLPKVEFSQFANNGQGFISDSDSSSTDSNKATQPMDNFPESLHLGNQKIPYMGRGTDLKYKGKQTRRNFTQPSMTRPSSGMVGFEGDYNNSNFHQQAYGQPKQSNYGTHNPKVANGGSGPTSIPGSHNTSWTTGSHSYGSHQNHYPQSAGSNGSSVEPAMLPVTSSTSNQHWRPPMVGPPMPSELPNLTSGPPAYIADVGNLNISEYSRHDRILPAYQLQNVGERRPTSSESLNRVSYNSPQKRYDVHNKSFNQGIQIVQSSHGNQEIPPPLSSLTWTATISDNTVWGSNECSKPSEYTQCLIGIILLALSTLKNEKIMPTEANITDCIRYGDPRHRNTDVKKALACALEQHLVVLQQLGALQLYVRKNEKLWQCVNPMAGNANRYLKSTWDEIQKFLSSTEGRSAMLNTECRYEAASILKNMCLNDLSLGEILQILQMVIVMKKWIICNHQSGWKPIKITIAEVNPDSGLASAPLSS